MKLWYTIKQNALPEYNKYKLDMKNKPYYYYVQIKEEIPLRNGGLTIAIVFMISGNKNIYLGTMEYWNPIMEKIEHMIDIWNGDV